MVCNPLFRGLMTVLLSLFLASCSYFQKQGSFDVSGQKEQAVAKKQETKPAYAYEFVFAEKNNAADPQTRQAILDLVKKNSLKKQRGKLLQEIKKLNTGNENTKAIEDLMAEIKNIDFQLKARERE